MSGSEVCAPQKEKGQRCWWAHRTRWAGLCCRSSAPPAAAPCPDLSAASTSSQAETESRSLHTSEDKQHVFFLLTWLYLDRYLLFQSFKDLCQHALHEDGHCVPLDDRRRQQRTQTLCSLNWWRVWREKLFQQIYQQLFCNLHSQGCEGKKTNNLHLASPISIGLEIW